MPQSFPLPLTAFEQYMLADDTRHWPMTYLMRFHFRGRADRAHLTAALAATLPAHPLISARIEQHGSRAVWVAGSLSPELNWGELPEPLRSERGMELDLHKGIGSRFFVRVGGDATVLTCQVHHAMTDGVGCLRFVADWLAAYHHLFCGPGNAVPAVEPLDMRLRDELDVTTPEPVSLWAMTRGLGVLAVEIFKFLFLLPDHMGESKADRNTPRHVPQPGHDAIELEELRTLCLTKEESQALRRAAKARSVTINDLLLRDVFVALAAWEAEQPVRRNGRLRLTMPTNMRDAKHDLLSISNVLSYVFVNRHVRQTADPEALLQDIHEETEQIKFWRLGNVFRGMVGTANKLGLLRPILRLPLCFSTMVVSNLGALTTILGDRLPKRGNRYYAGNLELEDIVAAPPYRSRTPLGMAVIYYDDRLSISAAVDTEALDASLAERFLELFRRQLLCSADLGPRLPDPIPASGNAPNGTPAVDTAARSV